MERQILFFCGTPQDTRLLGRQLGSLITANASVGLCGDLGAGKTCFVQGLAEGLGIEDEVQSPTFILMAEHPGPIPLLHADLYRVESADLPGIGLEEQLEDWSGISVVEWADRFPDQLPLDHLWIEIAITEEGREFSVRATGSSAQSLLQRWVENG
jgi:tRNA threonylcarbamoyladenosine biosynthesis protein TsaE